MRRVSLPSGIPGQMASAMRSALLLAVAGCVLLLMWPAAGFAARQSRHGPRVSATFHVTGLKVVADGRVGAGSVAHAAKRARWQAVLEQRIAAGGSGHSRWVTRARAPHPRTR
jgi:hypothetical protein